VQLQVLLELLLIIQVEVEVVTIGILTNHKALVVLGEAGLGHLALSLPLMVRQIQVEVGVEELGVMAVLMLVTVDQA
jgi:hypothetical protein